MNQALYAHMNNKRKRKKNIGGGYICAFLPKIDFSVIIQVPVLPNLVGPEGFHCLCRDKCIPTQDKARQL
jgi:hypothetical protein